jgi:hypothetical protein
MSCADCVWRIDLWMIIGKDIEGSGYELFLCAVIVLVSNNWGKLGSTLIIIAGFLSAEKIGEFQNMNQVCQLLDYSVWCWWRQHVSPKIRCLSNRPHGHTSQNMVLLTAHAVRISYLTWTLLLLTICRRVRINSERRLLAPSYLSVYLSVCLSAFRLSARIRVALAKRTFHEIWCWGLLRKSVYETPNLVKIGQQYRAPYVKI